jgi:hypothetical protein
MALVAVYDVVLAVPVFPHERQAGLNLIPCLNAAQPIGNALFVSSAFELKAIGVNLKLVWGKRLNAPAGR